MAGDQYAKGVDFRKGGFGKIMAAVEPEAFPHAFCNMYMDLPTALSSQSTVTA
ncbi:MAG: hypothetical protein JW789_05295 [Candidatus Aenigmarchaeota archaeon]|nr:hypothetical protein [Candidatus Aenigmarchaeota archaeon]